MARPLKRGRNRQRVVLYDVPESTSDTWGQPSQFKSIVGTFWADVVPLQGNETLNVRQVWPTATHTVRMGWLGSSIPATADNPNGVIVPQMVLYLRLDGSWLNVLFADNVEKRNRQWKLICQEKVGAGA